MNEKTFSLTDLERHYISAHAMDKLLCQADATACLVYLYILKRRGNFSLVEAMQNLSLSEQKVYDALGVLSKLGLLSSSDLALQKAPPPPPLLEQEELPQYSASEIEGEMGRDAVFRTLVKEVGCVLGKILTAPDLNILMGLYQHLGLPPEVIYQLVSHLTIEHQETYGEGRRPTLRGIEKIAYLWAQDEIITLEAAMEHISKRKTQKEKITQVKKLLCLRQDKLTPTQEKYIHQWLDMGFELEVLAQAYDRTMVQTGQLKWPYMNGILNNWHKENLKTQTDIEQKDKRPGRVRKKGEQITDATPDPEDLLYLQNFLHHMKGG